MKKVIIQLCADTWSDTQIYKENWYTVILIWSDIWVENYHPPKDVYWIIANPVCLEFSTARSDWKARNPEAWMVLVRECQRIISECNPVFWVIENPATWRLKDFLGKPQFTYQPWEFWSPWCKKTSLWGKFNIPKKLYTKWEDVPDKISELYTRPWRWKPSLAFNHVWHKKFIREFDCFENVNSDMEFRSLCSQKFAQAFFNCNQ